MKEENQIEEVDFIEIAEETFKGDLVTLVLDEMKAMPKSWQEIGEEEQDFILERLDMRVSRIIKTAVNILASQNRPVVRANVESITFKGGIKAVLQVPAHAPNRHDLSDAEGQEVMIVITGAEHVIDNGEGMPEADKDQPELCLEVDGLFDEALAAVKEKGSVSISFVQRHLRIGYNRAAQLVEQMQAAGWVSEPDHKGARHLIAGTIDKQEEAA